MDRSPIRVGIAGMGAAGLAFVPALRRHAGFDWVAAADTAPDVHQRVRSEHGVAVYATLPEMLAREGLDAVVLATPTPLHAGQAQQAAAAGMHVLVEKPMAVTLDEGRAMVDAAERAGIVLLTGHSHSFDAPIARMRELIASGELGRVRMVNTWCFSDWVQRPRRAEELDGALGGGVTFRQGSHQFDVIRLLAGGRASSVRAKAFDWQPQRRTVGAHIVFIDFEDGAAATAVYNGYGGLSSMDLCFDISEWGWHQPPSRRVRRAVPVTDLTPAQELQAKQARARTAIAERAPHPPFFGLTVVSCEGGDIRQSPTGLWICSESGQRSIEVSTARSPRDLVLDEWAAAITQRVPTLHDGRWGLANLEVCVAALQSSRSGQEVRLHEQVAVRA